MEAVAVGWAHRLVALAQGVAEQCSYQGNWDLAFGATGLRDTYSARLAQSWEANSTYPEDTYERAITASYADLVSRPGELVDGLVGSFLRGFKVRHLFLPALTAATIDNGDPAA